MVTAVADSSDSLQRKSNMPAAEMLKANEPLQ